MIPPPPPPETTEAAEVEAATETTIEETAFAFVPECGLLRPFIPKAMGQTSFL
jgi:hypothetical protein